MFHGPGDTCGPVCGICAKESFAAIGISELQNCAESTFVSHHSVAAVGGDDFIGPPAGGYLRGEDIICSGGLVEGVGYIIGIGALGLLRMSVAGLEEILSHGLAVEVEFVDSESCGHPFCRYHLAAVPDGGDEPACAVGAAAVTLPAVHQPGYYGCIRRGNPY